MSDSELNGNASSSQGAIRSALEPIMTSSDPHQEKLTSALGHLQTVLDSTSHPDSRALIDFADFMFTNPNVPIVVGRSVIDTLTLFLCGGTGVDLDFIRPSSSTAVNTVAKSSSSQEDALDPLEKEWMGKGKDYFGRAGGEEKREEIVDGIIAAGNPTRGRGEEMREGGWVDECKTTLKYLSSHIQEQDEEFQQAAMTLSSVASGFSEGGSRAISDLHKLAVYIKIVRLYLEAGESGLAQTTFGRAALLIHLTEDKVTLLNYKLCQARLLDHSRKFNEAASRYHELSFVTDIDEGERVFMLSAAVTCAILGPAGPQRSRILANLYRDDRTNTQLAPHQTSILRKMFLDQILRSGEVKEFEAGLAEHQLAELEVDKRLLVSTEGEVGVTGRRAPKTVLDRAVMEHNVLACAKVYDNIKFDGLGALLDLTPNAAEAMARTMIEQGRLRAWIDQVDRLIYFEGRSSQDQDDLQGTAGGLGVEHVDKPIQGISLTERWDERIKETATKVEHIFNLIHNRSLLEQDELAHDVPMTVD